MFRQFSADARAAIQRANDESRRRDHPFVGTEHILIGLLEQPECAAVTILKRLNVDLEVMRTKLLYGNAPIGQGAAPRSKEAFACAFDEVQSLQHPYVGTEHLLFGLVAESYGLAGSLLRQEGLTADNVRAAVIQYHREQHN